MQFRSDNFVNNKQEESALITGTTASLEDFRLQVYDYVTL